MSSVTTRRDFATKFEDERSFPASLARACSTRQHIVVWGKGDIDGQFQAGHIHPQSVSSCDTLNGFH